MEICQAPQMLMKEITQIAGIQIKKKAPDFSEADN